MHRIHYIVQSAEFKVMMDDFVKEIGFDNIPWRFGWIRARGRLNVVSVNWMSPADRAKKEATATRRIPRRRTFRLRTRRKNLGEHVPRRAHAPQVLTCAAPPAPPRADELLLWKKSALVENAHSETRSAELSSKLEAVNKRREELTKEMFGLMEQKQSYEEQIKVVSGELAVAGERIAEVDAEISKARATRPPRHPIPKSPDSCAARRTQHAAILAYDIISLSRTTTLSEELVSVIIDVKQGSRVAPPLTDEAERQGFGEAVYVNEPVRVRVT